MQKISYTSLRRTVLWVLLGILLVAVSVGIFLGILTIQPPFFDENAVVGTPEIPVENGYSYFNEAEVCAAYLCQNPDFDGKNADLFLTNPEENQGLFIRVEVFSIQFIYDDNGKRQGTALGDMLGKTGFIRPGEYVRTVTLDKKLTEQTPVALKIAVYEEETGKNHGSILVPIYLTPPQK